MLPPFQLSTTSIKFVNQSCVGKLINKLATEHTMLKVVLLKKRLAILIFNKKKLYTFEKNCDNLIDFLF